MQPCRAVPSDGCDFSGLVGDRIEITHVSFVQLLLFLCRVAGWSFICISFDALLLLVSY